MREMTGQPRIVCEEVLCLSLIFRENEHSFNSELFSFNQEVHQSLGTIKSTTDELIHFMDE